MNSAVPTKLNVLLKNLLQRKNRGSVVDTEIEIDSILWIRIFSVNVFASIIEKNIDRNDGQPLFDKAQSFGKFPFCAI